MSMIRGKLEAKREVLPQRVVFGNSPFIQENNEWKNSENPESKPVTLKNLSQYISLMKSKKTGIQSA